MASLARVHYVSEWALCLELVKDRTRADTEAITYAELTYAHTNARYTRVHMCISRRWDGRVSTLHRALSAEYSCTLVTVHSLLAPLKDTHRPHPPPPTRPLRVLPPPKPSLYPDRTGAPPTTWQHRGSRDAARATPLPPVCNMAAKRSWSPRPGNSRS